MDNILIKFWTEWSIKDYLLVRQYIDDGNRETILDTKIVLKHDVSMVYWILYRWRIWPITGAKNFTNDAWGI